MRPVRFRPRLRPAARQVARLSAQLRAELVRLGRVDDDRTVPLERQGTWAGVGDIVQARRNGWHLAGYDGNRRGPINREQYRVTAIRDNGDVEVVAHLTGDDQVEGDRMVLPANYVAEHLALGYASTVHAAQGLTVDSCHTVVTQATAADALYVGMTRGRHSNTGHVVTRAVPADAPTGAVLEAGHRSPAGLLAGILETEDPNRSALAQAVNSAAEAQSVRTPAELFADAAQMATAGRTASWLDQLVSAAEWTPKVDDPQWQHYLTTLARTADDRRTELARAVAADPPRWAIEGLGTPPGPDRLAERVSWEKKVASVAAYRELVGRVDEADALGQPPKPGQAETYAAWRSAWRALGRPEADRAEAEMSTGQLRVRIRAYEREKTWAPDHVADQLAGTRQAADKHRNDATLWDAQTDATGATDKTSQLSGNAAAEAAALAQTLDQRAHQLAEADEVRSAWYAHTAQTRAAAERAAAELAARRANDATEPRPVTAEEWLAVHKAEARVEDRHRPVTDEHELSDTAEQRARDQREAGPVPSPESAGTPPRDIREETAGDADAKRRANQLAEADAVRVPTADETAESVRRAQRALQELKQRQAADARLAENDARTEASRRHADLAQHLAEHEALADSRS